MIGASPRCDTPIKYKKVGFEETHFFGAASQSRTDDLILTKDVLYQLSHSSILP